jgi:hypothetical protein
MTIKNRADVVLRVEQFYETNTDKRAFSGTPRKKAEEYAMKRCEITEIQAKTMVSKIAMDVRGEIIIPNCKSKCKKGDSVKEAEKARNDRSAQSRKEWKENDHAAHPEKYNKLQKKYNKRKREKYATDEDFAEKIKQDVAERMKKMRLDSEDDRRQANSAIRALGEQLTPDDLLKQVYEARPDTRNAQLLLDDGYTIFHVTQVAPHELNPAGLLVPFDSHLENRKKKTKKKLTRAQLKSMEKVWGTPRSLADSLHGLMHMHHGKKVVRTKDFHVYAVTKSHPQYYSFKQHTIRGKNGA